MDFLDLAKRRYSVRKYENKPVEADKLNRILEAGRVAPTAANRQPHKVYAVTDPQMLERLSAGAKLYGAPLVLVVCADKEQAWTRRYDEKKTTDIDASIVTDHMMLEAACLGLGSLWICSFKPWIIRAELDIPEQYEVVNLLAIGYGADEVKSPSRHSEREVRKPLEEMVEYC